MFPSRLEKDGRRFPQGRREIQGQVGSEARQTRDRGSFSFYLELKRWATRVVARSGIGIFRVLISLVYPGQRRGYNLDVGGERPELGLRSFVVENT